MENDHDFISDEELAAFLDGNVCNDEFVSVMEALSADSETAQILDIARRIEDEAMARDNTILPMLSLAAANPQNLCSFNCETYILRSLGFDIDHWSLLETAKANSWLRDGGTPLHHVGRLLELKGLQVERIYDAHAGIIEKALNEGKHVIAVVDYDKFRGHEPGTDQTFHAIYITDIYPDEGCDIKYINMATGQQRYVDGAEFLQAWKQSGHYVVIASQDVKGYNPQPINVENISLDAGLEELTEAIAENAHDIWARARMDEGWTYGPVRNDKLKQHPDLVPYAQLPDREKEYDRLMAMNTLRLVRRLGFDIINLEVK